MEVKQRDGVGWCVATERASEIRDDLLVLRARHQRAILKTQRTQMNACLANTRAKLANTRATGHQSSLSRVLEGAGPRKAHGEVARGVQA